MHRLVATALTVALLAAPAFAGAATWVVDPAHSTVAFAVRHMMLAKVRGTFRTFSGTATGDPASPTDAVIEATIDAASIDTQEAKRDAHLKTEDFLDVAKYPTITFKSKKIAPAGDGKFAVTGDLTLHGVTREVVLDVEGPTAPIKDPMGKTRAAATATTTIDRRDFGISWSKLMEGGGLVVGNDIDITIDVEATQQP